LGLPLLEEADQRIEEEGGADDNRVDLLPNRQTDRDGDHQDVAEWTSELADQDGEKPRRRFFRDGVGPDLREPVPRLRLREALFSGSERCPYLLGRESMPWAGGRGRLGG